MANKRRTHLAGNQQVSSLQPKHLSKQEFGRRLYRLILEVSTSDPAQAWLRVNRAVSTKTAANVIKMLNDDDVANGN